MNKSTKPKNTGIPYENLTQRIFTEILKQDSVNTIKVDRNVKLKGKTTDHQIDVYWEFYVGNIKYITIVQAKDWGTSVNQGELLKFKAVIDDLPFQPKGIFVTQTSYQSGAIKFAKAHGIAIFVLRKPIDLDWEGKTRELIIEISAFIPETKEINIDIDNEWVRNELDLQGIPKSKLKSINISGYIDQIHLYNEKNKQICTIKKIVDKLIPQGFTELKPTLKTHTFTNPTFIKTKIEFLPFVKILSISAKIAVYKAHDRIEINADEIVSFILKDVLKGTELTFDKDLQPRNELVTDT